MYRPESDRGVVSRLRLGGTTVCVLFTVLFLAVHFTPLVQWWAGQLAHPWNDSDGDILIVLANEQQSDDIIGLNSYWRSVYAIRTWRAGHFKAMVISGGSPKGVHRSMASVMSDFIVCNGVPRGKVFLEERSLTTRENALFTKEMIGTWPGTKVLLTSDYHTYRALHVFQAVGLPVLAHPFPDVIKQSNGISNRGPCFWALCLETSKIAWYWAKGWIQIR